MQKIDFVNSQQPAVNDTNLNLMQDYIETAINAQVSGDTLPVGAIVPYTSDTIPDNWLLCNGQAVSRTTYSILFGIIGTTYGVGDGSTTFNLPDLRTRVPLGKGTATGEGGESYNFQLGDNGGEYSHILTVSEMPSHNHSINGTAYALSGAGSQEFGSGGANSLDIKTVLSIGNEGGGNAHNNLQPFTVTNFIIKATQSAGIVATVVDNLTSTSSTNALSANQGKVLAGTLLYQSSTGSNDTITLTDDVSNYKYIEIIFRVTNSQKSIKWERSSADPYCTLDMTYFYNNYLIFQTKVINISGTSITNVRYKKYTIYDSETWTPYGSDDNEIYIISVKGYNY